MWSIFKDLKSDKSKTYASMWLSLSWPAMGTRKGNAPLTSKANRIIANADDLQVLPKTVPSYLLLALFRFYN